MQPDKRLPPLERSRVRLKFKENGASHQLQPSGGLTFTRL
jgi:hypothetical protein